MHLLVRILTLRVSNMDRVTSENKSFKGSSIYLTTSEKEALKRAIDQYNIAVSGADKDNPFVAFYNKYDAEPLRSASKKLI